MFKLFIRKRLTVKVLTPIVIVPLSAWIARETGMPEDMLNEFVWGVFGLASVYILGQSWTDVEEAKSYAAVEEAKRPKE